jgi:hypothetical protein
LVVFGLHAICIVTAAGVVPAMMFFFVSVLGVNVPWMDEWDWLGLIMAVQHGSMYFIDDYLRHFSIISYPWSQHNEHRVFFPGILVAALSLLGGWNQKREELISVAIVSLELALVWRMMRRSMPVKALPYTFLAASLILFSLAQYENWTWGFQIAWFMGCGLALLSVFLLTQKELSSSNFAGALAASIASSCSLFFGLMSVPVGAAILIARRDVPSWTRIVWVVSGAMLTSLYFVNYNLPQNSGHVQNLGQFSQVLVFIFLYLGSLMGGWSSPLLASTFGCAGILIYAFAAVRYVTLARTSDSSAHLYLPWLGLGTFCVLGALTTSVGRVGWLRLLGPGAALASRYTTVTALFWISVVALAVIASRDSVLQRIPLPRLARAMIVTVVVAAFALSFVGSEISGYAKAVEIRSAMVSSVHALENLANTADASLLGLYPPDANIPRVGIKLLTLAGQGPLQGSPSSAFEGRGDEPSFGAVDSFLYQNGKTQAQAANGLPGGSQLIVRGWVCDSVTLKRGQDVLALIDGKRLPEIARYGLKTQDIASGFFDENLSNVGFEIRVDARNLRAGNHTFEINLKTQGDPILHPLKSSRRDFSVIGA